MMKSAVSNFGIHRERRTAESGAVPLNRAFPFGADRANAKSKSPDTERHRYRPIRVLALSRNFGWYRGVLMRLVLMIWDGAFFVFRQA